MGAASGFIHGSSGFGPSVPGGGSGATGAGIAGASGSHFGAGVTGFSLAGADWPAPDAGTTLSGAGVAGWLRRDGSQMVSPSWGPAATQLEPGIAGGKADGAAGAFSAA
jgi:hypothetical protein